MRQCKSEVFLHIVWTTTRRAKLIDADIERRVHRCIQAEAEKLGCTVLALDGMPDHVHIVLQIPTRISISTLVQQMKGASSHFINEVLAPSERFAWQDGYGVFSLSRPHVERAVAYVRNQKRHHELNHLWPEWEQTEA